jgi:TIR domain
LIFISHTKTDKPLVEPIALRLSQIYGKEHVFYDSWSIQPGDGIIDKMNDSLSRSKFFFFFVSKNSLNSNMVNLEWQNALYKQTKNQIKLIPVKIDDCLMPSILLQTLYIDFNSVGRDIAMCQMIDVINGKNTFREGNIQEFQNVRAHVFPIQDGGLRIEFRAEAYTEPQSKFVIVLGNDIDDISCNVEGLAFSTIPLKDWKSPEGITLNGFIVSRPNPTSPGFPFIVNLKFKSNLSEMIINGLYRATSDKTIRSIPIYYNNNDISFYNLK